MQYLLIVLSIVALVVSVFTLVFIVSVPHHLADIAFYLQKIAKKKMIFFDENT